MLVGSYTARILKLLYIFPHTIFTSNLSKLEQMLCQHYTNIVIYWANIPQILQIQGYQLCHVEKTPSEYSPASCESIQCLNDAWIFPRKMEKRHNKNDTKKWKRHERRKKLETHLTAILPWQVVRKNHNKSTVQSPGKQ